MFCESCGAQTGDEAKFCSACGAPTAGAADGTGPDWTTRPDWIPESWPKGAGREYAGQYHDGRQWVDAQYVTLEYVAQVEKRNAHRGRRTIWFVVILVAAASLAYWGLSSGGRGSPSSSTTARDTAPVERSWTPPSGFRPSNDPNVAYRFLASTGSCSYYDSCVNIAVVSDTGCPSGVYVEASLVSDGTLTDRTNEIGPAISPNEKARLQLGWLNPVGGPDVKITKVNCLG